MSPFLKALVASAIAIAPATSHAREFTPPAARAYCTHLTKVYKRYVGSPDFASYFNRDAVGGEAVAKCKEGYPAAGIPVLEHKLDDAKVPLPPSHPYQAAAPR